MRASTRSTRRSLRTPRVTSGKAAAGTSKPGCTCAAGAAGTCTECRRRAARGTSYPRTRSAFGHAFGGVAVFAPTYRGAGEGDKAKPAQAKKPAPKKPAGVTNIGSPRRQRYSVEAATLADAAAVINARDEAGLTEWEPKLAYGLDENGVLTSATVTVGLTITMPAWPGYLKVSRAARAEWDRFYAALERHEQGHVALVRQHLSGIAATLVGKSEADANTAFQDAVQELQEASDAYDVDTDHGRNAGTIIDTDVE